MKKKVFLSLFVVFLLLTVFVNSVISTEEKNIKKNNFVEDTSFITVKKIDGIWWFINSDGEKFFLNGAGNVRPSEFYYGDVSEWVDEYRPLIDKWNLNAVNGCNEYFPEKYSVARFRFKHINSVFTPGWYNDKYPKAHNRVPDVFDPWWREQVENTIKKYTSYYKDEKNFIGYYTDNEMKWGPDIRDELTILEVYMSAGNNTAGKQEMISFLSDRYEDIDDFNNVWNMDLDCFDDLNDYEEFGINDAWRLQSDLFFEKVKIYFSNKNFRRNPSYLKKAESDVRDFSRYVAHTYFNYTDTTLRKYDPNHLNLGIRIHILGYPREVVEEHGKYTDVLSINNYRWNKNIYSPTHYYQSKKYGCVTLDCWMKKYNEITDKPILISEYNLKSKDRFFPIINEDQALIVGRTEKKRSEYFEWYALKSLESPYVIGNYWFLFMRPSYGNDKTLVDPWGNPYDLLVKKMGDIYSKSEEIHEGTYEYDENDFSLEYSSNKNFYYDFKKNLDDKSDVSNIIVSDCKRIYVDSNSIYPGDGTKNWPYSKIQYAIDNSTDGDIIFVYSGVYDEKIIIDKKINLIGNSSEDTKLSGVLDDKFFVGRYEPVLNNNIITIRSDNVKVKNFNISTGSGFYSDSCDNKRRCNGIIIDNSDGVEISDNIFYNVLKGVKSLNSKQIKILNNKMKNIEIIVDGTYDSVISNNICKMIWISKSENVTIKNNKISNNKWGILFFYTDNSLIEKNRFEKIIDRGLFLKDSNNNKIISNDFIKKELRKTGYMIFNLQDYLYYEHATFLNSEDNIWNNNFWEKPRIIPKIIYGRKGKDSLIIDLNYDKNPAKNMNT